MEIYCAQWTNEADVFTQRTTFSNMHLIHELYLCEYFWNALKRFELILLDLKMEYNKELMTNLHSILSLTKKNQKYCPQHNFERNTRTNS